MFDRHYAARAAGLDDDSLKEVLVARPGVISFSGGLPDAEAFDMALAQRITSEIAADRATWQYAPTEGWGPLREALAAHMQSMGVASDPAQIMVTNGSQSALDLLAMALVDPGDRVLVEQPGYLGGLGAIRNYQGRCIGVPVDDDGLQTDEIEAKVRAYRPKFLYTIPTFQNPTGASLSLMRRRELVRLARKCNLLIVEDGAYEALRYEGDPLPPLRSLDPAAPIVYMGSFSKSLVPGVRVGWIDADRRLIQKLALLKQATDLASGTFGQRFVERALGQSGLHPPVDRYRAKRDACRRAFEQHLSGRATWNAPQGGFFYWLRLTSAIDTRRLLPHAQANGVSFVPGAAFGGESHAIRFSYSQVAPASIDEGVRRLARAIDTFAAA